MRTGRRATAERALVYWGWRGYPRNVPVAVRSIEEAPVHVLLLAAVTVDGKIARGQHELTDWTSREDRGLFVRATREAGVVVMGRTTYDTLPAPLAGRLNLVLTHRPVAEAPAGVEVRNDPPERLLARLAERGYTTVVVAGGAHVFRAFLDAGLVDELWLTVEPLAFGSGVSLFGDAPLELRLALLACRRLGEHAVHLRYRVER
jgi:dihydrofolate reductase